MPNNITATLQAKRGLYYVVLSLKNPDDTRKQKWIGTGLPVKNNKRAAEQKMREIVAQYESEQRLYDSNVPMWQLMEMWLESVKLDVRPSTYKIYKLVVEAHIIPYFKEHTIKAKDLLPRHLEQYYAEKMETLSRNTVHKHHSNIYSALEYARKNRIVTTNVAADIKFKKSKNRKVGKFYTLSQIEKLLNAVKGDKIEVPIVLISQLGLRRSEALGLKWDDIDYYNHTVRIHSVVVYIGTESTYVEGTKSESSNRTLFLSSSLENYLQKVYARQADNKHLYGSAYHDDGYICACENGDVIKPQCLTTRFKSILKKNELPEIRLHDLRHSAATNLLAQGFSLKDVSERMGHADISTTANIYGHVLEERKIGMANALSISL